MYTEPRAKRGRLGTNQEKRTQQKTSCIIQPGLTNENPEVREVNLEPSAKGGTDGTEALVSLY